MQCIFYSPLVTANVLLLQKLVVQPDTDIVIHVIDKDLGRTFPSHVLFAKKGSQGYAHAQL